MKKDEESIGSGGTEVNQVNFKETEDNESCKSEDDHFNLGEFEDQDKVSTDQDVG